MTIDTNHVHSEATSSIPFGAKLRAAREARNIDRKDAAHQLRLKEDILAKLEKDTVPDDLHVTFLRGYIRLYGKYLELPESEINDALDPIKPKPLFTPEELSITKKHTRSIDSNSPIVRIFTFTFMFLMVGLVALRWYNHTPTTNANDLIANNDSIITQDFRSNLPIIKAPVVAKTETSIKTLSNALPTVALAPTKHVVEAVKPPLARQQEKPLATQAPTTTTAKAKPVVDEKAKDEDSNIPAYARKSKKLASAKSTTKTPTKLPVAESNSIDETVSIY